MGFNWGSVDWGDVANAAVSLYGANQAGKAADKAGNVAAAGSDAALQLGRDQFAYQQQINAPFLQSQMSALDRYNALMGLPPVQRQAAPQASMTDPNVAYLQANPDVAKHKTFGSNPYAHWLQYGRNEGRAWPGQPPGAQTGGSAPAQPAQPAMTQQQAFAAFRNTPGYQFGMNQGSKALQASASASSGLFSGKAGKALTRYGQDYADQQGFTPYINRIASAAGIGQTNPVGNLQNASANFASGGGGFMQNAGQQRASGLLGQSQAKLWGLNQAGGFLNDAYGYYKNGGG